MKSTADKDWHVHSDSWLPEDLNGFKRFPFSATAAQGLFLGEWTFNNNSGFILTTCCWRHGHRYPETHSRGHSSDGKWKKKHKLQAARQLRELTRSIVTTEEFDAVSSKCSKEIGLRIWNQLRPVAQKLLHPLWVERDCVPSQSSGGNSLQCNEKQNCRLSEVKEVVWNKKQDERIMIMCQTEVIIHGIIVIWYTGPLRFQSVQTLGSRAAVDQEWDK